MHPQGGVGEALERFAGHLRSQVRAADADVHHIGDPLTALAGPAALAHRARESGHPRQAGGDFLGLLRAGRGAQRGVPGAPAFGGVDDVAAQHRLAAIVESHRGGVGEQRAQAVRIDSLPAQVQRQAGALDGEARHPAGIVRKQGAQRHRAGLGSQCLEPGDERAAVGGVHGVSDATGQAAGMRSTR